MPSNYRNILPPLFSDSKDERLIQISDLIIGVQMWKLESKFKNSSIFRKNIIDIVSTLDSSINIYEVEWNSSNTPSFDVLSHNVEVRKTTGGEKEMSVLCYLKPLTLKKSTES
jgi:hypothetical protein